MSLLELLGEEASPFRDEPCDLAEKNSHCPGDMPEGIGLWRNEGLWFAEGSGITVKGRTPEEAAIRLMRHLRIVTDDPALAILNQRICHGCSAPCCDVTHMEIVESKFAGVNDYTISFRSNVQLDKGDIERMFMAMMRRESGDKMEPTNDD